MHIAYVDCSRPMGKKMEKYSVGFWLKSDQNQCFL